MVVVAEGGRCPVSCKVNADLVKERQNYFRCILLRSLTVKERSPKFITKFDNADNTFCPFCSV